jgi:hypothetical protein
MAGLTFTLVPNSENISGKLREIAYDLLCDNSYPTGGYAILAAKFGWKQIQGGIWLGGNTAALGYVAFWNVQTGKLEVLRSAGFTPAGTVATPTITVPDPAIVVKGGAAGTAIGITADSNAGQLTKAAATDRTIPFSTLTQATITATSSTPAFTGTAVAAAALAQVSNGVNLATVSFRMMFRGW